MLTVEVYDWDQLGEHDLLGAVSLVVLAFVSTFFVSSVSPSSLCF